MKKLLLVPVTLGLLLSACRTVEFTPVQSCLRGDPVATAQKQAAPLPVSEILVVYSTGGDLRSQQLGTLSDDYGLEPVHVRSGLLPDVLRTEGDAETVAAQLQQDPRVAWAIPNFWLETLGEPDCLTENWNLSGFGVADAWGRGPGRHQVTVAVIDSGIDVDHPELREAMLPGFNFYDLTADPRPALETDRHGTHVAGIIAARGHRDVAGVAGFPDHVKVLPIRIFSDNAASASFDDLVLALAWAAGLQLEGSDLAEVPVNRHPADLINLSLGAAIAPHPGVDALISQLTKERGITVIAASGNDSPGTHVYAPANSADALAIGSVDSDYRLADQSLFAGPKEITVVAPGGAGPSHCGQVVSTVPGETPQGCMSGTSMAAPFVTGSLALLLTHEPNLTPEQLEARLRRSTYFDDAFMSEEAYGAGVLCANRLVSGRNQQPATPC